MQNNANAEADVQPRESQAEYLADKLSDKLGLSQADAYRVREAIALAERDAYWNGHAVAEAKRIAESKTDPVRLAERLAKLEAQFNADTIATIIIANRERFATLSERLTERCAKLDAVEQALSNLKSVAVTHAEFVRLTDRIAKLASLTDALNNSATLPEAIRNAIASAVRDAVGNAYRGSDPVPEPSRPDTVTAAERLGISRAIVDSISRAHGFPNVRAAVADAFLYPRADTDTLIIAFSTAIDDARRGFKR